MAGILEAEVYTKLHGAIARIDVAAAQEVKGALVVWRQGVFRNSP